MFQRASIIAKVAAILGVFSAAAFAGVEPSPFCPIWKIIIIIIGG